MMRRLLIIFFIILLCSLLTLGIASLWLMHYLKQHQHNVQEIIEQGLHQPVHLQKLLIHWQGINPAITVKDLTLGEGTAALHLDKLTLVIDLPATLVNRRLVPAKVFLTGFELDLQLQPTLVLQPFQTLLAKIPASDANPEDSLANLMTQEEIVLQDVTIRYLDEQAKLMTTLHTYLHLANHGNNHHAWGEVQIDEQQAMRFVVDFEGRFDSSPHKKIYAYLDAKKQQLPKKLIAMLPLQDLPTIKGQVSSRLEVLWENGEWREIYGDLSLGEATFNSKVFPNKIALKQLHLRGGWRNIEDRWQLNLEDVMLSDDNIEMKGKLGLKLPKDETSPFIDLQANLRLNNLANLPKYLPVSIMSKSLVRWLKRALVAGAQTTAQLNMQGRLSDYPFTQANGQLKARLNLQDVTLRFNPKWPPLTQFQGQVLFNNQTVLIKADHALFAQGKVKNLQATIADTRLSAKPHVLVKGLLGVELDQLTKTLAASPVSTDWLKSLAKLPMQGPVDLNLSLDVPLDEDNVSTTASANLKFLHAELGLPLTDFVLKDIEGKLYYEGGAISQ